ncbi:MAG: hypothetical protein JWO39_178 [Gemmatimonadetes bacterium]|jgi:hypothetical protein|nr:hypothetical protein [Gemmatimonadota bacterium]
MLNPLSHLFEHKPSHFALTFGMIASVALVVGVGAHCNVPSLTGTSNGDTSTVAAVPAVWSDRFVSSVGLATHFSYNDLLPYGHDRAKTIASLIATGARFVRDGLSVSVNGESNDDYWNAMRELTQGGMKLVLVTYPTRLGGDATDPFPYHDQRPLDTAIARVGAANVLAFEGPNEVDNNNQGWGGQTRYGEYARTFQASMYAHAKQIAPSVSVLGLTVTSGDGARAVGDVSAYMDAGTLHPYPDGDVPAAHLASMQSALAALNAAKKPWWVTETGYHTSPNATESLYQPGVSDIAQSKYVPRLYLDYFAAGIPYTSVYELIDEHDDKSNAEANYGLMYNDGTPKPAYGALRNLLALLADRGAPFTPTSLRYTLGGATSTIRQSLFQKRDGRFYLVLWNEVPVYQPKAVGGMAGRVRKYWERVAGASDEVRDVFNAPVPVSVALAAKARTITLYAPLHGVEPLSVSSNVSSIVVPVPDNPVVVEITP